MSSSPPKPVRAELVEALSFASWATRKLLKKVQSFDRLRTIEFG